MYCRRKGVMRSTGGFAKEYKNIIHYISHFQIRLNFLRTTSNCIQIKQRKQKATLSEKLRFHQSKIIFRYLISMEQMYHNYRRVTSYYNQYYIIFIACKILPIGSCITKNVLLTQYSFDFNFF